MEISISLKHILEYYYHIQTQLGVSVEIYCAFFVYTSNGYYLERINFNENSDLLFFGK